jgi:hypothetical protein
MRYYLQNNLYYYLRNYLDKAKTIIKYIPLEMAFAILLYQSLGFLELRDATKVQYDV